MGSQTFASPLGLLTVTSNGQALTALDWPEAHQPATPLSTIPTPETPDPTADAITRQAVAELQAWFAGEQRDFTVPLAPAGTPFQRRVWQAMAAIPYGQTWSYGQLAAAVGSAPRAIGGACGRNPLPIILPCHRVVNHAGALHGYSGAGALITKAWLLAHERRVAGAT